MKLHLVSLPHTQTTNEYLSCAYTQKVVKFSRMMTRRGHHVILYSGEYNQAECSEHVPLLTEVERRGWFGEGFNTVTTPLRWDANEPYWKTMNERAIPEIKKRAEERDLLLMIAGWCQQPIAAALEPMMAVEWGVGYEGVFAKFCAFESYSWMHHVYGKQSELTKGTPAAWGTNGRFYDEVIPNFFDGDDFMATEEKGDYLLFMGRLVERKGPHVAAEIASRVGMPLVMAGPGAIEWGEGFVRSNEIEVRGDVTYVGEVDREQRAMLLAGARAVLMPTLYVEPFGGVAVEAMLSGTPVVATDWGAFTETVIPGLSGERFRTLAEGVAAARRVQSMNPRAIREWAMSRYSFDAVAPRYELWFKRLEGLWGEGWYSEEAPLLTIDRLMSIAENPESAQSAIDAFGEDALISPFGPDAPIDPLSEPKPFPVPKLVKPCGCGDMVEKLPVPEWFRRKWESIRGGD